MPVFFDTHFHIDAQNALAARDVFSSARNAGVMGMTVLGTNMEECGRLSRIAENEPGVFLAVGVHPHAADEPYSLDFFRELLHRPKIVAIGEIGLDYYYDFSDRKKQRDLFEIFLGLAVESCLPTAIHCREAFADAYAIVKACLPAGHPFEIHSYSGGLDEAEKWLELGATMSLNGMVTFKKSDNIRALNHIIPDERLLLETDSPYLSPVPLRGRENSPANIPIICEFVARERNTGCSELAELTTRNALSFFKIRRSELEYEVPAENENQSLDSNSARKEETDSRTSAVMSDCSNLTP